LDHRNPESPRISFRDGLHITGKSELKLLNSALRLGRDSPAFFSAEYSEINGMKPRLALSVLFCFILVFAGCSTTPTASASSASQASSAPTDPLPSWNDGRPSRQSSISSEPLPTRTIRNSCRRRSASPPSTRMAAENQWTYENIFNVTYLYDGDGRRVMASGGASGTRIYIYDTAGRVMTELDLDWNGSNINEYLYLGNQRMARALNFRVPLTITMPITLALRGPVSMKMGTSVTTPTTFPGETNRMSS
jgi:hypothetical protein